MDDKLFDIFSEETTVPKCVLDRIDETLDTLERTEDKKKEWVIGSGTYTYTIESHRTQGENND